MADKERRVYDVAELAEMLGMSEWAIYKAVREDTIGLPYLRVGRRRIVFPRAHVDRMLGEGAEAS